MEENKEILTGEILTTDPTLQDSMPVITASQESQQIALSFREMKEWAEFLAKSTIVPIAYQNRPENCLIAVDMASRMGLSPMVVMQNLFVIQGKPSWSGQAIASMLRASKQFQNVTLVYVGEPNTDKWGAYVTATRPDGKVIKGGTVTIAIAKKEGWTSKNGSKWLTIPELMLAYRAYTWFGRVYAPELLMGLQSSDEIYDTAIETVKPTKLNPYETKTEVGNEGANI